MNNKTLPPFWISAIPIIVLIGMLSINIIFFGSDSLAGPSQIALFTASFVATGLGIWVCKKDWECIEDAINANIHTTSTSIFILLAIGMLSASWMISGIVPAMIYYGIKLIDARVFLLSACLLCALVSLMTGSSWTTIATIGIALIGIGRAFGFSDGWTAGAIISGAYFGDKLSPLSDTTVLASSAAETPLFTHVKYMTYTSVPSLLISLIIFAVAGFVGNDTVVQDTSEFENAIRGTFTISPWFLIVPIITGVMIYKKVQSLIVLVVSALMGIIVALFIQPQILMQIGGGSSDGSVTVSGIYIGVMKMLAVSTAVDTGLPLLNSLVATDGMAGMLNTIWLILAAMMFGGVMNACGMLQSFLHALFRKLVHTRVGLVSSTIMNGIFLNLVTGDQYISIILSANMFKEEYKNQGYENRLLSRSCEDGATVTSVLIPWNTCGMTQSTVLGVATLAYLPFCFFCYLSPIISIITAIFGWKIHKKELH
ncbi:MAG: sodium:proton antiporter [Paludibacteraceae bacterium]|nr:sodium:proton antiporter [Paludibacteraceae bacterium]